MQNTFSFLSDNLFLVSWKRFWKLKGEWGNFTTKPILYTQQAYKIYTCDLLNRQYFFINKMCLWVSLQSEVIMSVLLFNKQCQVLWLQSIYAWMGGNFWTGFWRWSYKIPQSLQYALGIWKCENFFSCWNGYGYVQSSKIRYWENN